MDDEEEALMELELELPSLLAVDECDRIKKRDECSNCQRPSCVCWCPSLPNPRVRCSTKIFILQHPAELHRPMQTGRMLQKGLEEGSCQIIKYRKNTGLRNRELIEILSSSNTLLLFPGPKSVPINDIPKLESGYNLVLLDGTWREAERMYKHNEILKTMKMVSLPSEHGILSKFVVKTQPRDECLCTLESAVLAISVLENRPEIVEPLTRPVKMACRFQLDCGAVPHESKERKLAKKMEDGL